MEGYPDGFVDIKRPSDDEENGFFANRSQGYCGLSQPSHAMTIPLSLLLQPQTDRHRPLVHDPPLLSITPLPQTVTSRNPKSTGPRPTRKARPNDRAWRMIDGYRRVWVAVWGACRV